MGMRCGRCFVRLLVCLAIALGGAAGGPAVADDTPVSVVDWLKAKGEDASLEARRGLFARLVGGEAYVGSAEQNVRLLAALVSPSGTAGRGATLAGPAPAQPRLVQLEGLEVTYDLGPLVLSLELAEDLRWANPEGAIGNAPRVPDAVEEPPVLPTLPAETPGFVCAALLAQKAKQFDDGLYAAVEEALQTGPDGKRDLLRRLRERLTAAGARDAGTEVIEAAARLGAAPGPTPAVIEPAVVRRLAAFEADPKRSKPLGFYPWTHQLKQVFRQDRMLQTGLSVTEAKSVVEALRADPVARATYVRLLRCYERLTNPYAYRDLRALLEPAAGPASDDARARPPAVPGARDRPREAALRGPPHPGGLRPDGPAREGGPGRAGSPSRRRPRRAGTTGRRGPTSP